MRRKISKHWMLNCCPCSVTTMLSDSARAPNVRLANVKFGRFASTAKLPVMVSSGESPIMRSSVAVAVMMPPMIGRTPLTDSISSVIVPLAGSDETGEPAQLSSVRITVSPPARSEPFQSKTAVPPPDQKPGTGMFILEAIANCEPPPESAPNTLDRTAPNWVAKAVATAAPPVAGSAVSASTLNAVVGPPVPPPPPPPSAPLLHPVQAIDIASRNQPKIALLMVTSAVFVSDRILNKKARLVVTALFRSRNSLTKPGFPRQFAARS